MGARIPNLARGAIPAPGSADGHTMVTESRPETTDDSPPRDSSVTYGTQVPLHARDAVALEGHLQGHTIITRSGAETSDDEGPR